MGSMQERLIKLVNLFAELIKQFHPHLAFSLLYQNLKQYKIVYCFKDRFDPVY